MGRSSSLVCKPERKIEGQIAAIITHREYAEPGVETSTVVGPYVDVTFKPNARTEIIFAAAAQIDQETVGAARGDPFYSSKLDVAYQLRDDMSVIASTLVEYDDDPGQGGTLTLTPGTDLHVAVPPRHSFQRRSRSKLGRRARNGGRPHGDAAGRLDIPAAGLSGDNSLRRLFRISFSIRLRPWPLGHGRRWRDAPDEGPLGQSIQTFSPWLKSPHPPVGHPLPSRLKPGTGAGER